MSVISHGTHLVYGRYQQMLYVLSGRAIVVRKGQRDDEDTTSYLLSSERNEERLLRGIAEFEHGEATAQHLK